MSTASSPPFTVADLPPEGVSYTAIWTGGGYCPFGNRFGMFGLGSYHRIAEPGLIAAIRVDDRDRPLLRPFLEAVLAEPDMCVLIPGASCPHGWTLEKA